MCRSVMASSFQKWSYKYSCLKITEKLMFEVNVKNMMEEQEEGRTNLDLGF